MDVRGAVCVVTGASSGIGRRTALDLARAGARVCATARREPLLRSLVAELGGERAGHSYVVCDVSRRDDVRTLARHVADGYGRCHALVNNAGYSARVTFEDTRAVDVVEDVMATNFLGAVRCTAELLALLERSAPASVVNVGSVAGRVALAGAAPYCASKFALTAWSESVRFDLAPRGIRVSLVEPGFVPTEGFPGERAARHPVLRRALGDAGDVSRAIRAAIADGRARRTVPRWYRLVPVAHALVPGAFSAAQRRLVTPR